MTNLKFTKTLTAGFVAAIAICSHAWACEDGEIVGVKTGNCIPASGECGTGCTYTLDAQGNLTVSGNGTIGPYAFYNNKDIVNTTISSGITSIKEGAFRATSNMEHINIPNSVTSIPEQLTFYDSGIKELIIPDSVTSLQTYYLAAGCSKLEYLYLPPAIGGAVLAAFIPNNNKLTFVVPATMRKCNGGNCSALSGLASPNIYCTGAQIESGLCSSSANRYEKDGNNYIVYNSDGSIKEILKDFHDFSNNVRGGFEEKNFVVGEDGNITLLSDNGLVLAQYDAHGNITASYSYGMDGSFAKYDGNGKLVGAKKTSPFTPAEAAALIKKGNDNSVTLTFK